MNFLKIILSLSFIVYSISEAVFDEKTIQNLYKDMTENHQQNKLRRYMIFKINREEIKQPEHFSRLVVDFFNFGGFQNGVYNIRNQYYIAFLAKKDEIKIKDVRDHFGNAFTKIFWFDKKNNEHDFRIDNNKNDL